jgi:hypothetical protein
MPDFKEIFFTGAIEIVWGPSTDPIATVDKYRKMKEFPGKYTPGFYLAKDKGASYDAYAIVRDR